MTEDFQALTVRITGRVQGVGFREWTRRQAERLGVSGWVRNEADRRVSALIAGPERAVAAMLDCLRRGPPSAVVTDLQAAPAPLSERPAGFRVLR